MYTLSARAHAKINLTLRILGRLDDGYHELSTHMHAVSLYDELEVSASEKMSAGAKVLLDIQQEAARGEASFITADDDNLAYKAARLMLSLISGQQQKDISIKLLKDIPVAAGLGGGSSDAACVMLALNALLGTGFDLQKLIEEGVKLGADVPFCLCMDAALNPAFGLTDDPLSGKSAHCGGVGEIITPLQAEHGRVTLIKPGISVSTREVYEAYDKMPQAESTSCADAPRNALEAVTCKLYPELRELIELLRSTNENVQVDVFMSGSGPTVCLLSQKGVEPVIPADISISKAYRIIRSEFV